MYEHFRITCTVWVNMSQIWLKFEGRNKGVYKNCATRRKLQSPYLQHTLTHPRLLQLFIVLIYNGLVSLKRD